MLKLTVLGKCCAEDVCQGSVTCHGVQQFNGPPLTALDDAYRRRPHLGPPPQPHANLGPPPPTDAGSRCDYVMDDSYRRRRLSNSDVLHMDTTFSNSSLPSATPAAFEPPDAGNQCKSTEDDRTLPSSSSNPTPPQSDKRLSTGDVSYPAEPLPRNNAERQSDDARRRCAANRQTHHLPNTDDVRGRSSDVVAMEEMSSRFSVGQEKLMDRRYRPNGRDGFVGRMGHPVAVDGCHAYRQSGIPHYPYTPPHSGFFIDPSYQYHGGIEGDVAEMRHEPQQQQQAVGLMTPPSSVTSSTSHLSSDCDLASSALMNGDCGNCFTDGKLSAMQLTQTDRHTTHLFHRWYVVTQTSNHQHTGEYLLTD